MSFNLKGISMKNRSELNVARYLTISLRGPVLTLRRGTEWRVLSYLTYFEKKKVHPSREILAEFFPRNVLFDGMGWDGMGWDG